MLLIKIRKERQGFWREHPPGRLGTTREVAEAAYFLVSEASSFISGVVLPVDGGGNFIRF